MCLSEFKAFSGRIEADLYNWLTIENAIKRREILGGTGFNMVKQAIELAKKELSERFNV